MVKKSSFIFVHAYILNDINNNNTRRMRQLKGNRESWLDRKSYRRDQGKPGDVEGQGEVFRRNHLIRLAESKKKKQCIVTFLKNNRFLLLCLSNQIYFSKNIHPQLSFLNPQM